MLIYNNELSRKYGQDRGYAKMIGNIPELTVVNPTHPAYTLWVPMRFFFCRFDGLALPLIALQYHEVKINVDIRPIDECLWAVTSLNCQDPITGEPYANGRSVAATIAYNQSLVAASLYVDYVFLDTDERRRMAQNPHEYLITQLQTTGDESVGSSSNKIKLTFN